MGVNKVPVYLSKQRRSYDDGVKAEQKVPNAVDHEIQNPSPAVSP